MHFLPFHFLTFFTKLRSFSLGLFAYSLSLFIPVSAEAESATPVAEEGFVSLLDGDKQNGWVLYGKHEWPKNWVIQDGVLHRKENGGDIMSSKHYSNFEFRFEFKIAPGGNSGIMYRVADNKSRPYETGPEYQILDNKMHKDGKDKLTSTASVYGLYARSEDTSKPAGEWNTGRIVLQGSHLEHWLNGKKVVECEIGGEDWNKRLVGTKFTAWKDFGKKRTGHLVLQDHGDLVWYRNLRIRKLEKPNAVVAE